MHKVAESEQLETERQALAAEIQNSPADSNKILLRLAMASLGAQIAILQHIEKNVRY
jgi:hypothetical protein